MKPTRTDGPARPAEAAPEQDREGVRPPGTPRDAVPVPRPGGRPAGHARRRTLVLGGTLVLLATVGGVALAQRLAGPEVLWRTSFSTPDGGSWQDDAGVVVDSRTNGEVVADGPEGREDVLRIDFPQGSSYGVDYRHSLPRLGVEPREEAWFSYDVYFPSDFEFRGDGKMGGLAGVTGGLTPLQASTGGTYDERSFSVRAMWKEDRGVVMYLYAAHGAGRSFDDRANFGFGIPVRFVGPDGSTTDVIRPGTWQRVDHHVRMNTPGRNDGVYELWIDGHRGLRVDDVQYRTDAHPDLDIDLLLTGWFFGGPPEQYPTRDNTAWVDDYVLSTGRMTD